MPDVTFTRRITTHDRETDAISASESTVPGRAMKVRGDPERYKALQLIEAESPTLLFVPTVYGQRIKAGDTIQWRNATYTARDCNHLEPDGVVIQTRVIIER